MNKHDFLQLSEKEQQLSITQVGRMLINYLQGETTIEFYKVGVLFVKITKDSSGGRNVEAYHEIDQFSLFHCKTESA